MSENKLPEPASQFYTALRNKLISYEVSKRDLIVMLFNAYIDSDFSFKEILCDIDVRYSNTEESKAPQEKS